MVAEEVSLYELLKHRLGADESRTLAFIQKTCEEDYNAKKGELASQSDIHRLEVRLSRRMYYTAIGQLLVYLLYQVLN